MISMYALRLAGLAILALINPVFSPVYASEVISLGSIEEITSNTRLEFNFKAQEPKQLLPSETVNTNLSKLAQLKKSLLSRELGPLNLKLNLNSATQLSRNNLSFKLDIIESYRLLKMGSESRSHLVQDLKILQEDLHSGLMFLRSPFDGAAVSLN